MHRVFLCPYPAFCKIKKSLNRLDIKKFPVSTLVP